jgi:hypothetical protein
MHTPRARQVEFGFGGVGQNDGYQLWVQEREKEMQAMARRLGLPLGHSVEVWLKDGTLLQGRLLLRGDATKWELVVGRVGFAVGEIESCVRTD